MPLHLLQRMLSDHGDHGRRYKMELDLLYYPIYDDMYFNVVIQWIANYFIERNYYHYWVFGPRMKELETLRFHLEDITRKRPPTFCLNDAAQKWENNQLIQRFYSEYFPIPAPIERLED